MQTAFVVWPQTTNPDYIWTTEHRSITWLNISLMYHMIGAAAVLLGQYLFVFYTHRIIYRFYKRYELDLETATDQKIIFKSLDAKDVEYSMLMNEDDE